MLVDGVVVSHILLLVPPAPNLLVHTSESHIYYCKQSEHLRIASTVIYYDKDTRTLIGSMKFTCDKFHEAQLVTLLPFKYNCECELYIVIAATKLGKRAQFEKKKSKMLGKKKIYYYSEKNEW